MFEFYFIEIYFSSSFSSPGEMRVNLKKHFVSVPCLLIGDQEDLLK